jgi:dephospho-CoA kinase
MLKVGLTGGLACGKSTVAEVLREMGCEVLDADRLGHEAIEPGGLAYQGVLDAFGADLLDAEGKIRRPLLAERVFQEPARLAQLNALVHPAILALVEERCLDFRRRHPRGILVVDAALILEAGVAQRFDKIVVVDCASEQQVARFVGKGLGSEEEARRRIAAQLPREQKLSRADFVLDSSGSLEETRQRARGLFQKLSQLV